MMTGPTRVAILTPPGSAAIATVALVGPAAWTVVRKLFVPASGRPLAEDPTAGAVWFGRIGEGTADEVVITIPAIVPLRVEVHCHGGRQVVSWLVELFRREGCVEVPWQELLPALMPHGDPRAWELLPQARTTRIAAILLDQCHGACRRALDAIGTALDRNDRATAEQGLADLMQFTSIGRHLIEPWQVAVVGAPNAGKSSLVNALAGYQRSVVASVPGTTRDVVTVTVAFDGWLVELSDTAGLRQAPDELERGGVARAQQTLAASDLCLWLLDTTTQPIGPTMRLVDEIGASREKILFVLNKIDLPPTWDARDLPQAVLVSARTGAGIDELIRQVLARLVPNAPPPGAAVPYLPRFCDAVVEANHAIRQGDIDSTRAILKAASSM
jgi:tRNA modification GTPase